MLGTVTIEIQLAGPNILMLDSAIRAGEVTVANDTPSENQVGRGVLGAATGACGAAFAAEQPDYTFTNLEFRNVRYHMGPEFDVAMANVLSSGRKNKLYFPNYTV
jgi:hypothetical protein